MNKNVLIAFGGATMIALVVAMLMSAVLKGGREKDAQTAATEAPPVQILVAAAPIKTGDLISETNIKWKIWPVDAKYPGVIERAEKQKLSDVAKGRALRPIGMDEPVTKNAIITKDGNFMAAMLKPGMRAVAVKVTAETMAGGFINPGDAVDVIMTYRSTINIDSDDDNMKRRMQHVVEKNLDAYATETILQNVRILGIDQRALQEEKNEEEAAAKVGKTVTVEVDDRQAEILALASQMGELSLSLRSLGDDKIVESGRPTISDARLTKIYDEVSDEIIKETGSGPAYVRVYNGASVTNLPTR